MTEDRAPSTGRVAVITDTTTAIPNELVESLDIQMIPYYVNKAELIKSIAAITNNGAL